MTEVLLDTMRRHLQLSIGECKVSLFEGGTVWRMDATAANGETWRAQAPDRYECALLLAEMVGFDVADG